MKTVHYSSWTSLLGKKLFPKILILCGILLLTSCFDQDLPSDNSKASLNQLELGLSFPPVSTQRQRRFTSRELDKFGIRLIRFAEDWKHREPQPGSFNWEPLDQRMNWITENKLELLLTIQSNGPDWACDPELRNERSCVFTDPDRFEEYLVALLSRYPNQISKIQFGNEWASEYWFTGSAQDFIQYHNMLYEAVQNHSPQTEVVLGGFSSGTLSALAYCSGTIENIYLQDHSQIHQSGAEDFCNQPEAIAAKERIYQVLGGTHYDWIDLHFYDFVEQWPDVYQAVLQTFQTDKPFLVSEFGGPSLLHEKPYSDEFQAERLAEYIQTLDDMGIPEAYFFKLVQSDEASPAHRESGLYKVSFGLMIKKPAYQVFLSYTD